MIAPRRTLATTLLAISVLFLRGVERAPAQSNHQLTEADIDRWMTELSNWGRWGKDDQMGTVNLITAAKRKQAVTLVREGFPVSLAHNTDSVSPDNPSPFRHTMLATGATMKGQFVTDEYCVAYHGLAHTHMDSLCHMSYKGKLFNGYSVQTVTDEGASKLPITVFKSGIMSRGILMDIPKLKGVPYLEAATPIYPEDLDAWEKKAGVRVGSGDIVLIRTGRWALREKTGGKSGSAGLHASCMKWMKSRDVAMVGSDAASDVSPSGVPGVVQPVHQLLLVAMGTPILDNCDLEALSAAAAQRNRWEFLLTAAPLAVTGGTGSPWNPIATF